MKYHIILMTTLLWGLSVVAQQDRNCPDWSKANKIKDCGENEFGVNIYSLTQLSRNIAVDHGFASGIMYKRHCKKNAVRVALDFFHQAHYDDDFSPNTTADFKKTYTHSITTGGCLPEHLAFGRTIMGELRTGYERKLTTKKLQPFVAIDFVLAYGKTNAYYSNDERIDTKTYRAEIFKVGFAPAAGLRYRPGKRFSITMETNANLVYYYRNSNIRYLLSSEKLDDVDKGSWFCVNPIRQLSLNWHF